MKNWLAHGMMPYRCTLHPTFKFNFVSPSWMDYCLFNLTSVFLALHSTNKWSWQWLFNNKKKKEDFDGSSAMTQFQLFAFLTENFTSLTTSPFSCSTVVAGARLVKCKVERHGSRSETVVNTSMSWPTSSDMPLDFGTSKADLTEIAT